MRGYLTCVSKSGYKIRDQQAVHFITFAVVEWIDVFTRLEYAEIIVDSLQYCVENKGLNVHAWCLMSNHIHLIVSARVDFCLSDILRDFKKYTAFQILISIKNNPFESRKSWMLRIFKSAGKVNSRNKTYQFWRQDNQPKELITNRFTDQKLSYLQKNPVTAGLVNRPEHYRWSSAADYAGGKGLIPIEFLD